MKREAIEFGRLEEVIERVLRELALAYGVDTDLLGHIIAHYSALMSVYLEKRIVVSKN